MENIKLIKSFIVKKQTDNFNKGEVITLRKYQAQIPLIHEELYFESKESGCSFSLKELLTDLNNNLDIHEKFNCIQEKFDYVL